MRWLMTIAIAVGVLAAIGLALNSPAQAAAVTRLARPVSVQRSLQQCIDAALVSPGDVIHIRPGVYTQSVTLNKPVSLVGNNAQTTILNAEPFQRVLTVTNDTITSSVIISGLALAHGNPLGVACPDACGGGVG
jgi:pectin methylesterase-like acyl-CoA thioesterase